MNKILFVILLMSAAQLRAQDSLARYSLPQLDSILTTLKTNRAYHRYFPYAQAGAQRAAKQYGKEDTLYAKMLVYLGIGYQQKRDYAAADQQFQLAAAIQSKKIPQSPLYAFTLGMQARLYREMRLMDRAEPLYLQALKLQETTLGKEHPDYASTLSNLSNFYLDIGDLKRSESLCQEALQIRKKALGDQHPDYLMSLNNLANIYRTMGQYEAAEATNLDLLQLRKVVLGEDHPQYANTLHNLGFIYDLMGQYEKAEQYYLQALERRRKILGEQHPDYANTLNHLGILYYNMGEYERAELFYLQAMSLQKMLFGGTMNPDYANSLNNLGFLYYDMGKPDKAEPLLLEAMAIRKAIFGAEHAQYAESLFNMGTFYTNQGLHVQAEPFFQDAATLRKTLFGEQHIEYARALVAVGEVRRKMGVYADALALYQQSETILLQQYGERYKHTIDLFNKQLLCAIEMGDTEQAWARFHRAITANSGVSSKTPINAQWVEAIATAPYISEELLNNSLQHAYLLLERSRPADYRQQQSLLADLALRALNKTQTEFIEDGDKLRLLAQRAQWVRYGLASMDLEQQAEQAFDQAEQNKSVLLLDAMQTQRAYQFGLLPDSLARQEQQLQKEYSQLKAALAERPNPALQDSLQARLIETNKRIDAFKSTVQAQYPQYAQLKQEARKVSSSDIRAFLPAKTALLEYVVGDSVLYIFYLDSKGLRASKRALAAATLKEKTQTLHRTLSDFEFLLQDSDQAYSLYTQTAHWFYQQLLEGILPAEGIEQLIVIPDGELAHLPFETFLTEAAPTATTSYAQLPYLMKRFAISYNYSARLWLDNEQLPAPSNNGQLLAMAAHYEKKADTASVQNTYRRWRDVLDPLPAARKEVETIAAFFPNKSLFDTTASERLFKQQAPQYSILHLAMHGILDKKAPLLSSLAFTDSDDSLENDFLQAYEISRMRLNADLVVLSACETGYGRFENGNGTASLARAFMYAGVPALVVSLWEVNDASTSSIMGLFYEQLSKGSPKDAALRQAKLDYLQQAKGIAAHPAYWSPFIQLGNTKPLPSTQSNRGKWLWLAGGLLLVVAGAWWWSGRRG